MSTTRQAVVVGAGVIGAATAHALSRSDWNVTIVDSGKFGRGCSHANCGLVCPSHVLPLAAPGALRAAFHAWLRPGGPLTIRTRFDPALWSWFWQFARHCNERSMLRAGHAIQALLTSSRRAYETILKQEEMNCEWEARGLLFVFQTRPAFEHYAASNELLTREFSLPARQLGSAELVAFEPALKEGLAGGWLYETDAHLRPDRLMTEWRRVLERRGVRVLEQTVVQGLRVQGNRAVAVVAGDRELPADACVLATGAWTPTFSRQLGCRLPIQPGKGYSITMDRPARCPAVPLILEEHRVAVTPFQSGYRLGSTMEFAGYDTSLRPERLALLRTGAAPYLHEPLGEPVREEWYGWRPMTYDGVPIIGPVPALSNVIVAAGHNMLGLSMAPATGQLVAELLNGTPPHIDPEPYRVSRY